MNNNPDLLGALQKLGNTVNTINSKVEQAKQNARGYRDTIISRLKEVIKQLNSISQNSDLRNVANIKAQLLDSQQKLVQKTQELSEKQKELDSANQQMSQLQSQLSDLNRKIQQKEQEIQESNKRLQESDESRKKAQESLAQLSNEKAEVENELKGLQSQVSNIVSTIAQINDTLVKQIGLIDTIVAEIDTDDSNGDNIAKQFEMVSSNIQSIINLLNNPGNPDMGSSSSNPQNPAFGRQAPRNRGTPIPLDQTGFQVGRSSRFSGGKRGRKTMKKRKSHQTRSKTRNLKGGYIYSKVNSELNKKSVDVTNSSSSYSSSSSGSKSKKKTTSRKSKK